MNELEVIVLKPDYEAIGPINRMTSLQWIERFYDYGEFKLWCPLTKENAELLRFNNLVWIGGEQMGVIETLLKQRGADNELTMEVSGRFNDCWLGRRITWNQYTGTAYASEHMRNIVNENAVNPSDSKRRLPNVTLANNQENLGARISYNTCRKNLWDELIALGKAHYLCPKLVNDVPNKRAVFTVLAGTDRSIEQNVNTPVVLSSELSDVLASNYASDSTDYYTTAQVAGAGEGATRKTITVGDEFTGLERREMSVDARDLQDTKDNNGTEEATPIPEAEYNEMMIERGKSKLADQKRVESFNFQMRMQGARAYEYGKDWFLGDRVTVQDMDLQIQVSTDITEIERTWDEDGYSITATMGNSAPTIKQLIRKGV